MTSNKRTSKVKNGILIVVAIAFLIAIIGGTYARYSSSGTANATGEIAKWHIVLGTEDISSQSKTLTVPVQDVGENENVAEGKLAPGKTVVATFNVDPTGSEVAVDYLMNVDLSNVSEFDNSELEISNLKYIVEGADTEQDMTVDEATGDYLFEEQLADVMAGKDVTFKIYITWTQSTDLARSLADTEKAVNIENVLIPVNIVARQHLEETPSASTYTVYTVGQTVILGEETFYVIEDSDANTSTVKLLSAMNVKTTTEEGQYTQTASANPLKFDSTAPYTNVYEDSTIKTEVNNYKTAVEGRMGSGKTIQEARLMLKDEAEALKTGHTDILYGTTPKYNYWLGSPKENNGVSAWFVRGSDGGLYTGDVDVSYYGGLRPVIIVLKSNI